MNQREELVDDCDKKQDCLNRSAARIAWPALVVILPQSGSSPAEHLWHGQKEIG